MKAQNTDHWIGLRYNNGYDEKPQINFGNIEDLHPAVQKRIVEDLKELLDEFNEGKAQNADSD